MKQRLTVQEFDQILQLSEEIIDYGRMIRAYRGYSVPNVTIEISELATRFRESPQTIKDALLLLQDTGDAEPANLDGCWKLRLLGSTPQPPLGFSFVDAPGYSL